MRKNLIIVFLVSTALITNAQDRSFARTYTTNILPKGAIDFEFWHTSRMGHKDQFFHAQDQRMELEFGLGKNVQTAFYFNHWQERFSTTNNGTETKNEIGFSNEWKWKLSDPVANKIGFALYEEWGIKGGDELELETKLIFDKVVGKSLFAFNATHEYEKEFEWENGKIKSDNWEMPVEFDLAYMYNINKSAGLGFEIRNHNEISKGEGWEHSVLFGGPTFIYRPGKWFVIANYLPQWGNLHKTAVAPFSKVLDEHERTEARILIGISF
ncbi:MAG: hypothetical protein JJE22_07740 [Bacteroidia bacterium]|nr:hypothetical protein [Bacteroidia bacterium]